MADNPKPAVFTSFSADRLDGFTLGDLTKFQGRDQIDQSDVFDYLRHLHDPEHPGLSLEQLRVIRQEDIACNDEKVSVLFTPTIPTCSVATIIGLTVLAKLKMCLPDTFKVQVGIAPGSHEQEKQVNKQLSDKERVCAALENPNLLKMIRRGVKETSPLPQALQLF
jgi:metal-sulfur cluster biosynthetic enzyme